MTERTKRLIELANKLTDTFKEFNDLRAEIRDDFKKDYGEYSREKSADEYGTRFWYKGRIYPAAEYYADAETPETFADSFPEFLREEALSIGRFNELEFNYKVWGEIERFEGTELVPDCALDYLSIQKFQNQ